MTDPQKDRIPVARERIPVADAAHKLGIPSWKAVRWIQSGRLTGGQWNERYWWVSRKSLEKVTKEMGSEPAT